MDQLIGASNDGCTHREALPILFISLCLFLCALSVLCGEPLFYCDPSRNVWFPTEAGLSKNFATIGPTEMHVKLRCPQFESRVITAAPMSLANSSAGPGLTRGSSGEPTPTRPA